VVLSLVERGGNIRSEYLDDRNIRRALYKHLHDDSRLVIDGSKIYQTVMPFAHQHESVDHSKFEWALCEVRIRLRGSFPCSSADWSKPINTWTRLTLTGG